MKTPRRSWQVVLKRKCWRLPVRLRSLSEGYDFVNGWLSSSLAPGLAP